MRCSIIVAAVLFLPFSASGQDISDAEIAAIVVTANQVDIDAGKLAVSRSSDDTVKAFAQLMITDHSGVNKAATELLEAVNTAGAANAAPKVHTILIEGMRYQPQGLTVAVGDTVVWVNRDMVSHTATSASGRFESNEIAAGNRGRIPSEPRASSPTSAPTIR